jgi:phosphatidylserine/phosphatidylglycerophosphate/cardiolipin synthase-like enzyme
MTTKIISREDIRAHILKVLSGYCFRQRQSQNPKICILSPWISDVQLEINPEVFASDDLWFGLDYGIASINFAYALLLLRLQFGAKIEVVTLPPNEKNYGESAFFHQQLLQFLDEIGCDIYLNSDLHSKLILSNDSALLGSFNLSQAALYNREEIGVVLDDIGNLATLDDYVKTVISSSVPYGYSPNAHKIRLFPDEKPPLKITRGILYEQIIFSYYGYEALEPYTYNEFLQDMVGVDGIYSKYVVANLAVDLERFYIRSLLTYLQPPKPISLNEDSNEKKLCELRSRFDYQGKFNLEEITTFLKSKLVRDHFPKIELRMKAMPKVEGE